MRAQWIRASSFQQRRVGARSSSPRLKFDSDFFTSCCSNRSAVLVIQSCIVSIPPTYSLLGGQHGEESEEGKDREEEEESQEEVVSS
jgi:hypothetical protein